MRSLPLSVFFFVLIIFFVSVKYGSSKFIMTTDELENHISPDDLHEFMKIREDSTISTTPNTYTSGADLTVDENGPNTSEIKDVDCFGFGPFTKQLMRFLNMRPDDAAKINTHFYFSSRKKPLRVQMYAGDQFGLEWVDFDPKRPSVMIVHGFMSHSNASWVLDMTKAFLDWADVNVFTVDWSRGGNTWKYWRAVANTRQVGHDVTKFLNQLMNATGVTRKQFHFVGHSLGAHISSYVSYHLRGVSRITGLDPAQPCFRTRNNTERLDPSDADFVDIIHTNGRLLTKIGFGLPEPAGHADFYPNGGMQQPGCANKTFWSKLPFSPLKLQQAICNHGRSYLLFTESLINGNCTFKAHRWNLTYEGLNTSMAAVCDRSASCSEMGINAGRGLPRARGPYFVPTAEREPYCRTDWSPGLLPHLLKDLLEGFRLDRHGKAQTVTDQYADPLGDSSTSPQSTTPSTYKKTWFSWWN